MLSSNYKSEFNILNLGIEMNQAFKLYPRSIVLNIAEGKIYAEKKLKAIKNGSDCNE